MNHLYTIYKEEKYGELKNVLIIAGALIGLGILVLVFSQGFSYIKSGEAYEPQVQNLLIQVRQEFLSQDLIRYFLLSVVCAGIVFAFYKRKVSFAVLAGVLLVIGLLDMTNIQMRYSRDFINTERMERQFFKKSATDEFLLSDTETFRIMPPPSEMNSNRWAYHHEIIGGYSPIKMYAVEELIQNCFNQSVDGQFPLNWNVIRMFNVKYIVLNQQIGHPNLIPVHSDKRANQFTYLLRNYLPRGFFVTQYKVIPDQYDRLNYINQSAFDPGQEVLLENELDQTLITPDSTFSRLTAFSPNRLEFEVFTDQAALFVISESYYPPGWKLYLDQELISDILRANHSMQAVIVPAGEHIIQLEFDPDSYHNNLSLARISSAIILLIILISLGLQIKNHGFPFLRAKSEND
jgi:hypothetical protein